MKKLIYIFFYVCVATSCTDNLSKDNKPTTYDFLEGKWILDSVIGQRQWIQEYIYFTPDHKFWRFSEYAPNYLLDSNLTWTTDKVYDNSKQLYSITVIDSNTIIIDKGTEKYKCERRYPFDNDDLKEFLQSDSVKRIIGGEWVLDSADYYPVFIQPNCMNLTKGTRINFSNNGHMKIFPVDTTNNFWCGDYVSRVTPNRLRYTSGCVVSEFYIELLNKDKLTLGGRFGIASLVKFKRPK